MSDVGLAPLLAFLDAARPRRTVANGAWRVSPVSGGANNVLYRAASERADLAVKFVIRDARDRAGREHDALSALRDAGLDVAPAPVLLDRASYEQPVVVQTWLEGTVRRSPPETDAEWLAQIDHLLAIHGVAPDDTRRSLEDAVLTARSSREGIERIREQRDRIPEPDRPDDLRRLVERVEATPLPTWPAPRLALCRADPNVANLVWRDDACRSVDWENSGWGDPAFELADVVTHPSYFGVPEGRRRWLLEHYAARSPDPLVLARAETYAKLLLVWWVARLARYLYEWPRGLDARLAGHPSAWQDDLRAKYDVYVSRATAAW